MIKIYIFIFFIIILHYTFSKINLPYIINNNEWIVIQYDNRDLTNTNFQKLMNKNKLYCNNNNIDYIYISKNYDMYPPYWVKVKIIYDMMHNDAYNKYKGFIWMDTDAVFSDENKKLSSYINNHDSFYISCDPPDQRTQNIYLANSIYYFINSINFINNNILKDISIPIHYVKCVGVFFVKNNIIGKKIMTDWWNKFNPNDWKKINDKWQTDGEWAGITYEQGAYNKYIYNKYIQYTKVYSHKILADADINNNEMYISHFMGDKKSLIDLYY